MEGPQFCPEPLRNGTMSHLQRPINLDQRRPPFLRVDTSAKASDDAFAPPQVVAYWTDQIRRASHVFTPAHGAATCASGPWIAALVASRQQVRLPCAAAMLTTSACPGKQLMAFAWEISNLTWSTRHDDLIEFALSFLEADVMLPRSGYLKRQMILQLRDVSMDLAQNARARFLLRRAVVNGTGAEEFRAFKKLSRKLVKINAMPDWRDWLAAQAFGAVVCLRDLEHADKARALALAQDRNIALQRLLCAGRSGPELGMIWPGLSTFVSAQEDWNAPPEQVRRNAFYMLKALGPMRP